MLTELSPATDSPPHFWSPANQTNRFRANRPEEFPIMWLILYLSGRPALDSIQTYRVVPNGWACHYLISGAGEIVQMLPESDWTPLTGNRNIDQRAIFIEVELENGDPATPEAMATTAYLLQRLGRRFGVPLDRTRILGAHEVPNSRIKAALPFDWAQLMAHIVKVTPIIVAASMPDRFFASKHWTRRTRNGPSGQIPFATAQAGQSADGAQFRVNVPQTGLYEVSLLYPESPSACAATPIVLHTARGQALRQIDQRQGGGEWQSVGQFPFVGGDYWAVAISRASPSPGLVIADSIRFDLVTPPPKAKTPDD